MIAFMGWPSASQSSGPSTPRFCQGSDCGQEASQRWRTLDVVLSPIARPIPDRASPRIRVMPLDKGKNGFTLPKLPYAEDALAPVVSAKTISFHYGKHHKAYVDKPNELIEGTAYAGLTIEEIVKKSAKDEK